MATYDLKPEMSIIIEGLTFGFVLALSLGPIFLALTQTSIEKGRLPGLTVGAGIWFSDILIVFLLYTFVNNIKSTIESPSFDFWMGLSGAIFLILFGIVLLIKKPILAYEKIALKKSDYVGFWLKGFLINTINPFTVVFWTGILSTYVIGRNLGESDLLLFLSTIIFVIVFSDTIKVFLAHSLKNWLKPKHVDAIVNLSGFILILFGLFLGYKVL